MVHRPTVGNTHWMFNGTPSNSGEYTLDVQWYTVQQWGIHTGCSMVHRPTVGNTHWMFNGTPSNSGEYTGCSWYTNGTPSNSGEYTGCSMVHHPTVGNTLDVQWYTVQQWGIHTGCSMVHRPTVGNTHWMFSGTPSNSGEYTLDVQSMVSKCS